MAMDRYDFQWDENGVRNAFGIYEASEDVARAMRAALRKVPSVTNLQVKKVSETKTEITGPDPV